MIRPIRILLLTFVFISAIQLQSERAEAQAEAKISFKQSVNINQTPMVILPDGRVIYKVVDKPPTYSGDLNKFLVKNLKYPTEAQKQKIQGKSVVQFIITSDGTVSDAIIVRSSGNELLDQEALRVTRMLTDWQPGIVKGDKVATYYNLPVSFKLD